MTSECGVNASPYCRWAPLVRPGRPVATAAGDNEWKWMEICDFYLYRK